LPLANPCFAHLDSRRSIASPNTALRGFAAQVDPETPAFGTRLPLTNGHHQNTSVEWVVMDACCTGNPLSRSRREFLTVGALGALGLTLGDWLKIEQQARADEGAARPTAPRAKGIIHIFLPGGMAQQESFDPKPLAPLEFRGSFSPINTKLPGVQFCETMPLLAQVADKIAVVRSMTHSEAAHERGTHNMFTGYRPSPALVYPSMGSVISHELGVRNALPPYVCIPNVSNPYAGTGFLGSGFGPFSVGGDPANAGFRVRDLSLPTGVDDARFDQRKSILEAVNSHFMEQSKDSDAVTAMDSFYQRAYDLVSSPAAREAFNLEAEPAAVRDRYGRNTAGQRMLLARRLIAAGVRMVSLTYGGWDFHAQIVPATRRSMPDLDKALAALVNDLDAIGMLDDTLVLLSTEFGRTPKVNNTAGRDHWPRVFSIMMCGGGLKRGYVHGSSNATAAEPENDPVYPGDLFATIYHLLGVDYEKRLLAPGDRPIDIVREGRVVQDLLA
jgi:hypothetical protein